MPLLLNYEPLGDRIFRENSANSNSVPLYHRVMSMTVARYAYLQRTN